MMTGDLSAELNKLQEAIQEATNFDDSGKFIRVSGPSAIGQ